MSCTRGQTALISIFSIVLVACPDPAPPQTDEAGDADLTESGSADTSSDTDTGIADESTDTSADEDSSSEAEAETGSETSGETQSDSGTQAESETQGETGSGSEGEGEGEGEGESEDETAGETDGGSPIDPSICPLSLQTPVLALSGVEDPCEVPEVLYLALALEGDEIYGNPCAGFNPDYQDVEFTIELHNNNWAPIFHADLFDGSCREVHLHMEGRGECVPTRLDVVDLDAPQVPIYSIGLTAEQPSAAGLEIEPVNPTACESSCRSGSVYDLKVEAAGQSVVLEAGGLPWAELEVDGWVYQVMRIDSVDLEASTADGCEGVQDARIDSWVLARALAGSEPSLGEGGGSNGGAPGSCVGELADAQADEFVGDGIVDMSLSLRTVDSEPPLELTVGSRVHLQGTAFGCCDEDIYIGDSVVVRSYPDERFMLGQVEGNGTAQPVPDSSFFTAIDSDLETWLRPFTLAAHDDLICSKELYEEKVMSRMRLRVDGGECETAKIMDEEGGAFGDLFFVLANNLTLWVPSGQNVDTVSGSRVFISRQTCEPGECPQTADQFTCPSDGQWPEDRVQAVFDGDYEPESQSYDLICEIMAIDDDGQQVYYRLDCG
ncbi:hypothetical protein G6O69_27750 [Pseudenhygromyxa sp. WMMC2535]|uniref:hypothetical protein n=1 Tax=Pseudenhygromyxa sp. WMMC2535 TaxID=2712867 RepID=UPI00155390C6|nr:hypothetical protein [Pseudenhygromyxa sp. WMMC2535]NVB41664.1 hypothetical protein [Pseudenhygromyxa sp. WMMC2535]